MKLAKALSEAEAKKIQSLILFGGAFTTLAIWTKLEDPVNLPKMFVLVVFAAMVFGLSLTALLAARDMKTQSKKFGLGLVTLFLLGLLVSTSITDVRFTAIFGEYHRNNGFLSYLAMAILMAASIVTFSLQSLDRYFKFFGVTGLLLTFYGFLQAIGKDPVGWVILYNPFVTTLGNPNFTSAFLGLTGISILYLTLSAKKRSHKSLYAIGLICNLYILQRSDSIQGVFGFLIGATIILITKAWMINKRYGQIALVATAFVGSPVALAVFNIGPLASRLYQGTLRNRVDYWNAALAMIKDQPIFGVGIDRFGEYYRQYTVQNQIVPGQFADNAHSVYLQIFSTGGLFMGLPYLLLIIFVTFVGARGILLSSNSEKLKVSSIFAIWISMLVVNIVTIDNLGLSVWFWITGGVLVAASASGNSSEEIQIAHSGKTKVKKIVDQKDQAFPMTLVISFALALAALVILIPNLGRSSSLYYLKNNVLPASSESRADALVSEAKSSENNPQQLIQLANLALSRSAVNDALPMIKRINELDSRSYYGNYFAAIAYEAQGKVNQAISYRETLLNLDPWGTENMVQLIRNYIAVDNLAKAKDLGAKLKDYYPGSQADIDASAILAG
jgi:O-antigen ligase